MTFNDPLFLQNLGRVTISFALLDGSLTAVMNWFFGLQGVEDRAAMRYGDKVKLFIRTAVSEFEKLGGHDRFDRAFFDQLHRDLKAVAVDRNRMNHDFWTFEADTWRMMLKGLKRNSAASLYPTPESLFALSDRIYEVRNRLPDVVNEYVRFKHECSTGNSDGKATVGPA